MHRHVPILRAALRALGEAIRSRPSGLDSDDAPALPDPIVTVHPDRLLFEALTRDAGAYLRLTLEAGLFELDAPLQYGTTTVDFDASSWLAVERLRSSHGVELRIEPADTDASGWSRSVEGASATSHPGLRALLQINAAMSLPGLQLTARPVDLLAAIRLLHSASAEASPRALRYELEQGQDARLVLEPWEHTIALRGARHRGTAPRSIRTWGRHALQLIEPLLPFSERVEVHLKGRALPSFYWLELPGMTFVLGLTGSAGPRRAPNIALDLLSAAPIASADGLAGCAQQLAARYTLDAERAAAELAIDRSAAALLLARLAQQGRAIFDPATREYRLRELFAAPDDQSALTPTDVQEQQRQAIALLEQGRVQVARCEAAETRATRRFTIAGERITRDVIYRDWRAMGQVADQPEVTVVLDDSAQLVFGKCDCAYFRAHALTRGPCAHLLALYQRVNQTLRDLPSSQPATARARDSGPGYADRASNYPVDSDDNDGDKAS